MMLLVALAVTGRQRNFVLSTRIKEFQGISVEERRCWPVRDAHEDSEGTQRILRDAGVVRSLIRKIHLIVMRA